MFDHVKFGVSDYAASKAFFLKALEPLGVTVVTEWPPNGVELSQPEGTVSLCLYQTEEKPAHLHVAFVAENRQQVDAFYRAALEAGGQDNGAPGLRPHYHANYYAAFVLGPDGHNIEAVCHAPGAYAQEHTLYGAAESGSVAVEAALTLLNIPFKLIEGATWASETARERVGGQNAMRQIPTLVLPSGEILTESAGILVYLADLHPQSKLSPGLNEPARGQFLRWMLFVSSAIYALHWIKPDVTRIGAPQSARDDVVNAVHERIAFCWRTMDAQLNPAKYLLGDNLSVLDLYVAVVSRFGPWRDRFYAEAPRMTSAIKRVDEEPRLKALWESRFPQS